MDSLQLKRLRETWELVRPEQRTHAAVILYRLFRDYPDVREKFPNLKSIPVEQLMQTARVKAHAGRIMKSLEAMIEVFDDEELLEETISLLADTHMRFEATVEEFQVFQKLLMEYLRETLQDAISADHYNAFDQFLTIFNSKMALFLTQQTKS